MTEWGLNHFWTQLDGVGRALTVILAGMSMATWTLLAGWALQGALGFLRRNSEADAGRFAAPPPADWPHSAGLLADVQDTLQAVADGACLAPAGGLAAHLTRVLRQRLDAVTVMREQGLAVLASIASTAPYLGLLGTVWGIYHALVAVSATGQAGLDAVAGPVGEALIMTALGLSVAIPAVLGHNLRQRRSRLLQARLEDYATTLLRQATVSLPDARAKLVDSLPTAAVVPVSSHQRA